MSTEIKKKYNCWEFMKCGKGPGTGNTKQSGICPVVDNTAANGLNGGVNGGRMCWLIAETKCCGEVKHSNQNRSDPCFSCEFRYKVMAEEGLLEVCNTTGEFLANLKRKDK
ncbi:MAG: hypothetical protein HY757_05750 [Nitrospirae bacterium]|nr:hypothetical protein [Nitrospirota bacterium]